MRIVRNPNPVNHGMALLGAFCAGVVVGVALCAGSCAHAAHAPTVGRDAHVTSATLALERRP